jgi:hypothetical protein
VGRLVVDRTGTMKGAEMTPDHSNTFVAHDADGICDLDQPDIVLDAAVEGQEVDHAKKDSHLGVAAAGGGRPVDRCPTSDLRFQEGLTVTASSGSLVLILLVGDLVSAVRPGPPSGSALTHPPPADGRSNQPRRPRFHVQRSRNLEWK